MKTRVITELVGQLHDLLHLPTDCKFLTQIMHDHGINIRYLSHIYVLSSCTHIKDLCLTAMLARTIKNVINQRLSDLVLTSKQELQELQRELKAIE